MLSVGAHSNYLTENTGQIYDHQKDVRYRVGRFLGKGGFARCYEVHAPPRGKMLAAKVVSRESISKKTARSKMVQEIRIHRDLSHKNVVKMLDHFTDERNVYVILELCESQSLMELHKRRQIVSEEESRYFMGQIVDGLEYVHGQRVIHRDLKLGNLFLTGDMIVKIGDFGLATRVSDDNELKTGLCGTPNYTAPEMLGKKGHLYEVDIWALGCILYTLLVGKPPFETSTLQETYARIRKNRYNIPSWISPHATSLIRHLLANQPSKRPKVTEVKSADFFKKGYWPAALPTSCLTMRPKFNFLSPEDQSMCSAVVNQTRCVSFSLSKKKGKANKKKKLCSESLDGSMFDLQLYSPLLEKTKLKSYTSGQTIVEVLQFTPDDFLESLRQLISTFTRIEPAVGKIPRHDDIIDPASKPVFWISNWMDASDKYGLGYRLSDNSSGAIFNDHTTLSFDAGGKQAQYVDKLGSESYYRLGVGVPDFLQKKLTLVRRFENYMATNLKIAGENFVFNKGEELMRLPMVRRWVRLRNAIFILLDNGTLQVNFFEGHDKFIVCPRMEAVTWLPGNSKDMHTFKISKMIKYGVPQNIRKKMLFIETILGSESLSRMVSSSCPPTPTPSARSSRSRIERETLEVR